MGRPRPSHSRRARRSAPRRSAHRRTAEARFRAYELRRNTRVFTGAPAGGAVAAPLFLTPHRSIAEAYGEIRTFKTTRPLRLVAKVDALHALRSGRAPRGEWDAFGHPRGDRPVAAALCRRRTDDASWAHGLDGWIHRWSDRYLAEILVCDLGALREVAP